MKNKYLKRATNAVQIVTLTFVPALLFGQTATTTAMPNTIINNDTKPLLGITFDSRTGMNGNTDYIGYFDPAGYLIPNISNLFNDFPLNGVRYPGQAIMTGFQWKKAIGSIPRPFQDLVGPMGPSQSMDFGFDEFMTYCEKKGLTGKDIQIMVPIYDSAITYLEANKNKARVPNPAASAADWVEYANAPPSANWGGGLAWGAIRAANGHPAPYNIKTWNLGNEPWGPFEMNFDTSQFFPIVKPIIDSMLARDPSIHITLPTTGKANNNWNKMIRSYQRTYGNIYGISPHFFSNAQTVDLIESTLKTLIDSSNAVGLKVINGDFSHEIHPGKSTLEQTRAMSWKGVRFTVDMLLLCSQLNTIERANHWIYGIPLNGWHPIRKEAVGVYTLLPVGEIYKILSPYFLQNSLSVVSTSPVASDGHPYSLRASAFKNATNDTITVVAINRDSTNALTYLVSGLSAYSLCDAKILTSDSLTGETIFSNIIAPDMNGYFNLPASSILLLSYCSTSTVINQIENTYPVFSIYPNPSKSEITIRTNIALKNAEIIIYNVTGQEMERIQNVSGQKILIPIDKLTNGVYIINIKTGEEALTAKLIVD